MSDDAGNEGTARSPHDSAQAALHARQQAPATQWWEVRLIAAGSGCKSVAGRRPVAALPEDGVAASNMRSYSSEKHVRASSSL